MISAFFLGKFKIEHDTLVLTEESFHSDMLTKLLTYLIINREHPVTIRELCADLWEEGEIENPQGALKNLMYRLRIKLKETLGRDDFIVTGRGFYKWNTEIEMTVDAEQFVEKLKQAGSCSGKEQQDLLREAVLLYQGEFGGNCKENYWIATQKTYYRSMYISAVKVLVRSYLVERKHSELEKLCRDALTQDLADEELHCMFIKSFILQDKLELAQKHLDRTRVILQEALGIRSSKALDELQLVLHQKKKSEVLSLQQVMRESTETDEGAFLCNFSLFKQIVNLESRRVARLGMTEYLGMLSIQWEGDRDSVYPEMMLDFVMSQAMDKLEKIVHGSLRAGDVYCRINDSQISILLPGCNEEAATVVLKRILGSFSKQFHKEGIIVKLEMDEIAYNRSAVFL